MRATERVFYSVRAVVAVMLLMTPLSANAAVMWIVDGTGQLTGAQNVEVNRLFYDVEFVDGTCVALFSGCDELSDWTFQTHTDAEAAAQALLDQVFLDTGIDGSPTDFDSLPHLTYGCSAADCWAMIPFDVTSYGVVSLVGARNDAKIDKDLIITTHDSTDNDLSSRHASRGVYARWTLRGKP